MLVCVLYPLAQFYFIIRLLSLSVPVSILYSFINRRMQNAEWWQRQEDLLSTKSQPGLPSETMKRIITIIIMSRGKILFFTLQNELPSMAQFCFSGSTVLWLNGMHRAYKNCELFTFVFLATANNWAYKEFSYNEAPTPRVGK